MKTFGKFMSILLSVILGPIIYGFVVIKLWAWFIVPTFDANPLRLVEAIGIMFLINYVKIKRDKDVDNDNFWKDFAANWLYLVLMSGLALLSGWIVSLFM